MKLMDRPKNSRWKVDVYYQNSGNIHEYLAKPLRLTLRDKYFFGRPGGGSRKNPFIEIPFPDDWHWIFLPSCSVSVKAVYSSFAIWNRAHGHLLISLHPTCFCVQPRLNARDRCKSDFILPVDIFREARRGLSDKYLLRSQRVSPIIYWAKIIQYNPHSISTKPFLSPLIFYWALIRTLCGCLFQSFS